MSDFRHGATMVDDLCNEFAVAAAAILRSPERKQLLREYGSISAQDMFDNDVHFLWSIFTDCMTKRAAFNVKEQPQHIDWLGDLCVYMRWNLDNYDMIMKEFPSEHYSKISTHLREVYLPAVQGFLKLDDAWLKKRSAELIATRAAGIDIFLPISAEKWHNSI